MKISFCKESLYFTLYEWTNFGFVFTLPCMSGTYKSEVHKRLRGSALRSELALLIAIVADSGSMQSLLVLLYW